MKITSLIWIASILPLTALASSAPENEVAQTFSSMADAMNRRDIDALMKVWTTDAEVITLAGGIYKGSEEIKEMFSESFSNPYKDAKYGFKIQYVRFDGTSRATVDGVWKTDKAGPPNYPSCGIFIYQMVKDADGWKVKLGSSSVPRQGHTAEHGRKLSWVQECKEKL